MKKIISAMLLLLSLTHAKAQDLIPFRSGSFWGFCNSEGTIVIPPVFDFVYPFQDSLASVAASCNADCFDVYDGKYGFINSKGDFIIPPIYDRAMSFRNGKAYVLRGINWYVIDKKNQILIDLQDTLIRDIAELETVITYVHDGKRKPVIWDSVGMGYKSQEGIQYWEDPEAAFILNFKDVIITDKPEVTVNKKHLKDLFNNPGTQMSPSLVVIQNADTGMSVKTLFLLKEQSDNNNPNKDIATYSIQDPESFKPYKHLIKDNKGEERLFFVLSSKIPSAALKNKTLFALYLRGINFVNTTNEKPLMGYSQNMYDFAREYYINSMLDNMVEDIQLVGKTYKEMGDNQNITISKGGEPYEGQKLFDLMENVTKKDVWEFLRYVQASPFYYMGKSLKISEAFATWAAEGAPRVIETK